MRTTTDPAAKGFGLPSHRPPTHPGEMLLEEFLVPMGVTQAAAARRLRVSTNRLNELVKGKRGMTADTALRLAAWLGTTPQFWLHLQVAWDLWHAARTSHAGKFIARQGQPDSTARKR
ncbi:MAG: HigA family addiction module antitoxin [Thermoanaerobaculia bacterium]